jgi:putative aldouronate transport system substrate-binding protein
MTKRFTRLTSLGISLTLTASLLAGCGGEKKTATQKSTQEPAKAQEPVKIDWLAYPTVAEPDPNSEIAQFIEKKFNVKFNYWFVDDQKWDDVLNVKLASGEMPDVLRIKNRNNVEKYVKQGVLAELPEASIRKSAPNYAKIADKYDKTGAVWNALKSNGKNYGFTNIALNGSYPTVVAWRGDWLKNVGITKTPETLQEFETAIYKFRNEDPDKNGKKDTYGMSNNIMGAIFGAFGITDPRGLGTILKDGKVVYTFTQPEAKEALAYLQKWYKDGVIDPEFVTGENKGGYWALSHALINGRIGVTGSISFYHVNPPLYDGDPGSQNYQEIKKVNPNAEIICGKPPVGPNGKSGTFQSGVLGESVGITTKGAKDPRITETVLKMLDALYSDDMDYAALNSYGKKDVDYNITKDGIYNLLIKTPAEARKKGLFVYTFGAQNPDITKKFNPPLYAYADKVANFTGYVGLTIPPTETVTKNTETLNKIVTEACINIITGAKPVDSLDEYVKQFKSNGGDECEKAMTDAYNKMLGK